MSDKQVLLNDAFKTKVANLSSIAELGRAASLSYGHPTKEILEINIDDPVYLKITPNESVEIVNYKFDKNNPKPENQEQKAYKSYKVISPIFASELPNDIKEIYPNGLNVGDIVYDAFISNIEIYKNGIKVKSFPFDILKEDNGYEIIKDYLESIDFNREHGDSNWEHYEEKFHYSSIINFNKSLESRFEPFEHNYWQYKTNDKNILEFNNENKNIGLINDNYFEGKLSDLVCINKTETSSGAAIYYVSNAIGLTDKIITENKAGECSFKIAIPTIKIIREQGIDLPYYYFKDISNITNISKNEANNMISFIAWGRYKEGDPDKNNFRFILAFKPFFNETTQKFEIYVSDYSGGFVDTNKIKIPNWDGNSVVSFKCTYYEDNSTGDLKVIGELYYRLDDNDTWRFLKIFEPSNYTSSQPNSVQFGNYSYAQRCSIGVKELSVKSLENHGIYYQDNFYKKISDFISDLKLTKKYHYNISGNISNTNKLNVHWFYNKIDTFNSNENEISPNYDIDFGNDYATKKSNFDLLAKKQKNIKFVANKGTITGLDLEGKQIYKINVTDLSNLTSINLKNNKLKTLDLSNNINLSYINTENNPELSTIIFPKSWNSNEDIIIYCDNKLLNFELCNDKEERLNVNLNLSDMNTLNTLVLRNINIKNINEFINNSFNNIQYIDLTNSNILDDIESLRLFVNNIPNRSDKKIGKIYLYGNKYVSSGVKGSTKDIVDILLMLKQKNWLFYV